MLGEAPSRESESSRGIWPRKGSLAGHPVPWLVRGQHAASRKHREFPRETHKARGGCRGPWSGRRRASSGGEWSTSAGHCSALRSA